MKNEIIGDFIKQKLKENNMTQEDLAEKLNITKSAVSQALSGKNTFDIQNLITIADIFNTTLDSLVRGESSKEIIDINFERIVENDDHNKLAQLVNLAKEVSKSDFYNNLINYALNYKSYKILKYILGENLEINKPEYNERGYVTNEGKIGYKSKVELNTDCIEKIRCLLIQNNDVDNLETFYLISSNRVKRMHPSFNIPSNNLSINSLNDEELSIILSSDVNNETLNYLLTKESGHFNITKFYKLIEKGVAVKDDEFLKKIIKLYYNNFDNSKELFGPINNISYESTGKILFSYIFGNEKSNFIDLLLSYSAKNREIIHYFALKLGNAEISNKFDDNLSWNRSTARNIEDRSPKGKFEYALESRNKEQLRLLKSKTSSVILYQELATYGYYDELKEVILNDPIMRYIKILNNNDYNEKINMLSTILRFKDNNIRIKNMYFDFAEKIKTDTEQMKENLMNLLPEDSINTEEIFQLIIQALLSQNKAKISGITKNNIHELNFSYYYIGDLIQRKIIIDKDFELYIGLFLAVLDKNIDMIEFLIPYSSIKEKKYSYSLTDSIKIRGILGKNSA